VKTFKVILAIVSIVALWVLVSDRALAFVPDRSQLDPTQTRCITRCANDAAPPLADGSQPYGPAGTIVAVHDPAGGTTTAAIPSPQELDGYWHQYPDYVTAPRVVTLAVSAVGTICPAPLDQASLTCDPYSFARWNAGAVLSAGGYVTRFGVRFYWVDAGINVFGGHDYGWLDARVVR
jgi:hypothetical protein